MKKLILTLGLLLILIVTGCGAAGDPILDDLYTQNVYPGAAGTYSVGSEDLPFREGWFDSGRLRDIDASVDGITTIEGDTVVEGNLEVDGATNLNETTFNEQIVLDGDGEIWLEFRPALDLESVRAHGVPTWVTRGVFGGVSLPIYAADNEELQFEVSAPNRWSEPAWTYLGDVGDEPGGMAVLSGLLFIPCEADDDVWVYDGTGFSISGNVGDAPVYATTHQGKIYVSCAGDDTVWVYSGGIWALSGNVGNSPEGMVSSGGDLYVACRLGDEIWRLSGGVWAVDPALGAGGVAGAVGDAPIHLAEYGGDIYVSCAGADDDVWIRTGGAWAKDADVGNTPQEFHEHGGGLYLNCEDDDTIWYRSGGVWALCPNIQTNLGNAPIGLEEYEGDLFSACMDSIWADISGFWNQNSDFNEVTADEPMFLKVYEDRLYCSCKDGDGIWIYGGETAYIHIDCWMTAAQANATDAFRLFIEYENCDPGIDILPNTGDDVIVETLTGVVAQYQTYEVEFPLDMTGVDNGDDLGFRLQRIASSDEIAGEVAILHTGVIFECDKLGDSVP